MEFHRARMEFHARDGGKPLAVMRVSRSDRDRARPVSHNTGPGPVQILLFGSQNGTKIEGCLFMSGVASGSVRHWSCSS